MEQAPAGDAGRRRVLFVCTGNSTAWNIAGRRPTRVEDVAGQQFECR